MRNPLINEEKEERQWAGGFKSGENATYKGERVRIVSCLRSNVPSDSVPVKRKHDPKGKFLIVPATNLQRRGS